MDECGGLTEYSSSLSRVIPSISTVSKRGCGNGRRTYAATTRRHCGTGFGSEYASHETPSLLGFSFVPVRAGERYHPRPSLSTILQMPVPCHDTAPDTASTQRGTWPDIPLIHRTAPNEGVRLSYLPAAPRQDAVFVSPSVLKLHCVCHGGYLQQAFH